MSEIWAVLEHNDANLHEQSGELLSELVDIASRQLTPATVCAVLLHSQQAELPDVGLLNEVRSTSPVHSGAYAVGSLLDRKVCRSIGVVYSDV